MIAVKIKSEKLKEFKKKYRGFRFLEMNKNKVIRFSDEYMVTVDEYGGLSLYDVEKNRYRKCEVKYVKDLFELGYIEVENAKNNK